MINIVLASIIFTITCFEGMSDNKPIVQKTIEQSNELTVNVEIAEYSLEQEPNSDDFTSNNENTLNTANALYSTSAYACNNVLFISLNLRQIRPRAPPLKLS